MFQTCLVKVQFLQVCMKFLVSKLKLKVQGHYQNPSGFAGKTAVSYLQSQFYILLDSLFKKSVPDFFKTGSTLLCSNKLGL